MTRTQGMLPLRTLAIALIFSLVLSLAGCGTIIYPERRGQTGGRIDPAVAILDGVGLLVFLVPGLIAFAIDFATGAIYLPGMRHAAQETDHLLTLHLPPDKRSPEALEAFIKDKTGHVISFQQPEIQAFRLDPGQNPEAEIRKSLETL